MSYTLQNTCAHSSGKYTLCSGTYTPQTPRCPSSDGAHESLYHMGFFSLSQRIVELGSRWLAGHIWVAELTSTQGLGKLKGTKTERATLDGEANEQRGRMGRKSWWLSQCGSLLETVPLSPFTALTWCHTQLTPFCLRCQELISVLCNPWLTDREFYMYFPLWINHSCSYMYIIMYIICEFQQTLNHNILLYCFNNLFLLNSVF